MDPTKPEGQTPENTGTGRQAIFTPQPPEPATPETTSGNSAASANLSHPYFSNHPTQTYAVETGDIILNSAPTKTKHNKRPFIIGGIILVAFLVICAVVLMLIQILSRPNRATVVESFATYKNYIEFGPNNSGETESWYIAQLSGYLYDSADATEEIKKINELYADFRTKLQESGVEVSDETQHLISTETALLEYATLYINLDNTMQPLITTYLDPSNNLDAATLAAQIVPAQSESSFRNGFRNTLLQYIKSSLEIQSIYNNNYCIVGESVDSDCVALLDEDAAYTELLQQNESTSLTLQRYASRLWAELETCTEAIWEKLNA